MFRDCNGESNGIELPEETVLAEAAASGDEEVIVFPDVNEEELEELSQQVVEEEEEALSGALPLPVLDDLEVDYDDIPLNGLYQAPGAQ